MAHNRIRRGIGGSFEILSGQGLAPSFSADAISAATHEANARLKKTLAALQPPENLDTMRAAYSEGLLGLPASPRSQTAKSRTITGPGGAIQLRILIPKVVRGVYLHLHGGGWMAGSNDTWDRQLELIGHEAGMVSVSPDYRLAPEFPFPAAVDDCVAVASWLIEHSAAEFGSAWLSVGGESAGANLAALTLLRLRDMGSSEAFRAANLLFGCYDLSLTPSMLQAQGTPFVTPESMKQFTSAFACNVDLRDPAISPLYADLQGMPPALFSVGSIDPLVDDSLFMHARWQAAGNDSTLAIYPGGVHGFNSLDSDIASAANLGMARFLGDVRQHSN